MIHKWGKKMNLLPRCDGQLDKNYSYGGSKEPKIVIVNINTLLHKFLGELLLNQQHLLWTEAGYNIYIYTIPPIFTQIF